MPTPLTPERLAELSRQVSEFRQRFGRDGVVNAKAVCVDDLEFLLSAVEERDRLAKRVGELVAKYEPKPVACPTCESDDTSPYETGGYVCFNCQKDFTLTRSDR